MKHQYYQYKNETKTENRNLQQVHHPVYSWFLLPGQNLQLHQALKRKEINCNIYLKSTICSDDKLLFSLTVFLPFPICMSNFLLMSNFFAFISFPFSKNTMYLFA